MKYLFFGGQESPFAQIILDGLTQAGLPPLASIRDAKASLDIETLKSYNADFFLVAAFAKILKKDVIAIPSKGTIGIHPSILPKYRGASPIQSALLRGEKQTGTSIFLIDEKVDHGPIIRQQSLAISDTDTYISLLERLARLSANLCLEALPQYVGGDLTPMVQDEKEATFTKKLTTLDAEVNLEQDKPENIWRKIKALNPEPGAFTQLILQNKKILRLKLLSADFQDGKLYLQEVQPEGKKPMAISAFLNGYQQVLPKFFATFYRG
ncbi:MAG TPA: methionyl-tRNA formyltransferase [Candidatus Paceibacterota bacterium]